MWLTGITRWLSGAKEKYRKLFFDGLSFKMKQVLASDPAPTIQAMLDVGWNKGDFLQGAYGKLLVPDDPKDSSVAALYMGSATGVGNGQPKGFGLKGRRRNHELESLKRCVHVSLALGVRDAPW
jgi:hypothetical protein